MPQIGNTSTRKPFQRIIRPYSTIVSSLACFRSFQCVLENRARWSVTLFLSSLAGPRTLTPPRIVSQDVPVEEHRATKIELGVSYSPGDLPRKRRYAQKCSCQPPCRDPFGSVGVRSLHSEQLVRSCPCSVGRQPPSALPRLG